MKGILTVITLNVNGLHSLIRRQNYYIGLQNKTQLYRIYMKNPYINEKA